MQLRLLLWILFYGDKPSNLGYRITFLGGYTPMTMNDLPMVKTITKWLSYAWKTKKNVAPNGSLLVLYK